MTRSVDPRIERTRTVVLRSAIEIVAERGFAGATIDAIAQRSGVARSTIYRHWPERMDLLLESVESRIGDVEALTVGELRADLTAVGRHIAELLSSEPLGSVVASIILESRREPALDDLRRRLIAQRQRAAERVLAAATERGELRADVDSRALATDLAAHLMFRSLVLREAIETDWVERQVDHLLRLHAGTAGHS